MQPEWEEFKVFLTEKITSYENLKVKYANVLQAINSIDELASDLKVKLDAYPEPPENVMDTLESILLVCHHID